MAISTIKRQMLEAQGKQLNPGQLLMLDKGPFSPKRKLPTASIRVARFSIGDVPGPLWDPVQSRLNREAGYWS